MLKGIFALFAFLLLATTSDTARGDVLGGRILTIESTAASAWSGEYARLLAELREGNPRSTLPGGSAREADEIALRLVDTTLRNGGGDEARLASVLRSVTAPELKAAGFVTLARKTGSLEWLQAAMDALDGAPPSNVVSRNVTAAIADSAVDFGDLSLAETALSRLEPGTVRASVASRLARSLGMNPDGFKSWTDEVQRLEKAGDVDGAIELAIAADARDTRKARDKLLRGLSVEALEGSGTSGALTAAGAIYSPRMYGLALKDIGSALAEAGRFEEALQIAEKNKEPRSASALWLDLADEAPSRAMLVYCLERAFASARLIDDEATLDDYTADVLKRLAEKGWHDQALSALPSCVQSADQRDKVTQAAEKRAASPRNRNTKGAETDSSNSLAPGLDLVLCEKHSDPTIRLVKTIKSGRDLITPAGRGAAPADASSRMRSGFCATPDAEIDPGLEPIPGLKSTEGYGSDQRAELFSWTVMVLAGRQRAGDDEALEKLTELLTRWAEARAFEDTEVSHDAYYALKRSLLPTIFAFSQVERRMAVADAAAVRRWLDGLVRRIDKRFGGDVDQNNHRYLADSVLMVWGSWVGDVALFNHGVTSLETARRAMRPDGSLPLEVRRGARALWYMRQAASSFTLMIEMLRRQDNSALADKYLQEVLRPMISYIVDGILYPTKLLLYTPENYIPGPSKDYFRQDLGFLEERGHGRQYMAWVEPVLAGDGGSIPVQRLHLLADREFVSDRPLIDEFAGGNATCFWAHG